MHDVTQNTLASIPIWDFYFDISEWHILSARAWTPALMLHLTNPCAKRKVLSLTKPKGKIYKTKFLGNYITKGDMKAQSFYKAFFFFFFFFFFLVTHQGSSFRDSRVKLVIHTRLSSRVHDAPTFLRYFHWVKRKNNDKKPSKKKVLT